MIRVDRDATAAARAGALRSAAGIRAATGDVDLTGTGDRVGDDQDATAGTTRLVRRVAQAAGQDRSVEHQLADIEVDHTATGTTVVGAVLVAGTTSTRELRQVNAIVDLARGAGVPAGADAAVAAAGVRGRGAEPSRRAAIGAARASRAREATTRKVESGAGFDGHDPGDRAAHRPPLGEGHVGAAANPQAAERKARRQTGVTSLDFGVRALERITRQEICTVAQIDPVEAIFALIARRRHHRARALEQ